MALLHVRPKRWTVEAYERLVAMGAFGPGERVELINGEIIPMTPQNPPHARAIMKCTAVLVGVFGPTHRVGVQVPFFTDHYGMPEPDFVVVTLADFESSAGRHPSRADLIVEVADTSLSYDRDEKSSLYARCGVPEYWIVNLGDRRLEVFREPSAMPDRIFGHGYGTVTSLDSDEAVSPLALPSATLCVADLLD